MTASTKEQLAAQCLMKMALNARSRCDPGLSLNVTEDGVRNVISHTVNLQYMIAGQAENPKVESDDSTKRTLVRG